MHTNGPASWGGVSVETNDASATLDAARVEARALLARPEDERVEAVAVALVYARMRARAEGRDER
jgi:hypothetical protein